MSHSLKSLKEDYIGTSIGLIKGDTRSLDFSSFDIFPSSLLTACKIKSQSAQGQARPQYTARFRA